MRVTNIFRHRQTGQQRGVLTVELALVLGLFLLFVFAIIEFARLVYMFNTLPEVTRRAAIEAAAADFTDSGRLQAIRETAMFRDSPGLLAFGSPVSDAHVNIEFLALTRGGSGLAMTPVSTGNMPACPAKNKQICSLNPNDSSCVRLVRVRICEPGSGSACGRIPYKTLISWIPLPIMLPVSTTIVPVGTLGYTTGSAPSCD